MASIRLECFTDQNIAKNYICGICQHVALQFREHVTTDSCQYVYCNDCAEGCLAQDPPKCAFCPAVFNVTTLKPPRLSSRNTHDELKFDCPYCGENIAIQEVKKHMETCLRFPKSAGISKGTNTDRRTKVLNCYLKVRRQQPNMNRKTRCTLFWPKQLG